MTALLAKSCANDFYKEKENCFEEMTHIEDVPSTQGKLKKYCLMRNFTFLYFLISMTRKRQGNKKRTTVLFISNKNSKYQISFFLYSLDIDID